MSWSSVLLGLGGAALGWSCGNQGLENVGEESPAGVIGFGVVYGIWGARESVREQASKHFDMTEGQVYVFEHRHSANR